MKIVDRVRRKELGRWTGRRSSSKEQTPDHAGSREEVGNKRRNFQSAQATYLLLWLVLPSTAVFLQTKSY